MIRPIYNIYHARYISGGPFPGYAPNPWYLIAMYNNLESVKDFLEVQKAFRNMDRYRTEADVNGSFDLFRVDVEIDLCKS